MIESRAFYRCCSKAAVVKIRFVCEWVPFGNQFGLQIDGAAGSFDDRGFGSIGGHLFWRNSGRSDVAIERAARAHGVVVRAMSRLYLAAPARSGLMLGFSGYPPPMMAAAAARLAGVIQTQSERSRRRG